MGKYIEVELKFQVGKKERLEAFLNGLQSHGEKRVVDDYYDTPSGELFQRGIFLRIRDGKQVDFKFNLDDISEGAGNAHEYCDEYTYRLPLEQSHFGEFTKVCKMLNLKAPDKPDFQEFCEANGFVKSMTIDKLRRKYTTDTFEISVDDVKDLGEFVEVEYEGKEGEDYEPIKRKILELVEPLEVKLITTGYNEVYWRKHNFDLYLKGKYLLDEDRVQYKT